MSPTPPDPSASAAPEPGEPGSIPESLPPPGRRPVSPELIADLHARRRWFAAVGRGRSYGVMSGYLERNWHDAEAQAWAGAGVEARAALAWRTLGLRPEEGARLQRDGHAPEATVLAWQRTPFPAEEVADWIGAGLTPQEAVAQRADGVTRAQAAALRAIRNLGG